MMRKSTSLAGSASGGESAFLPPQSGESGTHEQRIAELERFCGQLALENQVLKKALQSRGSGSGMS